MMAQKVRLCPCLISILALLGLWPCLAESANLRVTGRITSNGQPIQGEIIVVDVARQVRMLTFRSDSLGAFDFEIVPGPRTVVVAKADGCVSAERELMPAAGGHANLNFTLSPAGSISGRVINEAGAGVAGAVARVHYPGERRSYQFADELGESITDDFGNFTLPFVAEDRPFVVEAETTDRLPSVSRMLTFQRATASGVVVTLGRMGQVVRGKVFDAAGAPAGGVNVRMRCLPAAGEFSSEELTSASFLLRSNKRTTTGPDGGYEFRGVPAGRVMVVASRPGAKPVKAEGTSEPGGTLNIDLTLK
jgi:hypothetical protein